MGNGAATSDGRNWAAAHRGRIGQKREDTTESAWSGPQQARGRTGGDLAQVAQRAMSGVPAGIGQHTHEFDAPCDRTVNWEQEVHLVTHTREFNDHQQGGGLFSDQPQFLTVQQASKLLRVSTWALYQVIRD